MHHIMQGALSSLAEIILKYPRRIIVSALLPCIFFGVFIAFTPLQLSFMALVDQSEPLVARYVEVSERIQLGSQLLLLLEGEEAALDETMKDLHEGLEEMDVHFGYLRKNLVLKHCASISKHHQ